MSVGMPFVSGNESLCFELLEQRFQEVARLELIEPQNEAHFLGRKTLMR